ncbi:site-specific integrase [Acidocella aminolytica]|uniref:Phage DNA recombinase n=1 Tax=Acidocella aminolytica 101 = DSM 11237 TaxID=1120923 RepID=A0A0D6PGT0_9PROT|nr:site-specific integrase [Acidocella aminolytica]GAN80408.1 phage DNA recombinase [Acidocella aminolytica 101 = DSM 11237]SHF44969.1 Site-specific recombinase XerD [Acidocella aminolytica 101 = DSM 11237]
MSVRELSEAAQAAIDRAEADAAEAKSAATARAYRADLADFRAFCAETGLGALPATPETVAAYLSARATSHSHATLRRRLAAIGAAQAASGFPWVPGHPVIRDTLRGIARRLPARSRPAGALTTDLIRRLVATCDTGMTGTRDRALLLIGYAGALRRGELVAIERSQITFENFGLRLLIPTSKTDQEGQGAEIGIPRGLKRETCPVRAIEEWLRLSECDMGPVFRRIDRWGGLDMQALHPDAVRRILLRRAAIAHITMSGSERLSPHGLRAGFITEAYQAGARDEDIMQHSRHRSLTAMRRYVRRAKAIQDSPAKLLGL